MKAGIAIALLLPTLAWANPPTAQQAQNRAMLNCFNALAGGPQGFYSSPRVPQINAGGRNVRSMPIRNNRLVLVNESGQAFAATLPADADNGMNTYRAALPGQSPVNLQFYDMQGIGALDGMPSGLSVGQYEGAPRNLVNLPLAAQNETQTSNELVAELSRRIGTVHSTYQRNQRMAGESFDHNAQNYIRALDGCAQVSNPQIQRLVQEQQARFGVVNPNVALSSSSASPSSSVSSSSSPASEAASSGQIPSPPMGAVSTESAPRRPQPPAAGAASPDGASSSSAR